MWNYQREEQTFEQVPVGKHRIRVMSVEKTVSKSSGRDMLAIQFEDRMLTAFYDSFADIPEGSTDIMQWLGKVGACMVKVDKNDPDRTRLSYFIKADKQDDLPPWKEPEASRGSAASSNAGFTAMQTNDIPF